MIGVKRLTVPRRNIDASVTLDDLVARVKARTLLPPVSERRPIREAAGVSVYEFALLLDVHESSAV